MTYYCHTAIAGFTQTWGQAISMRSRTKTSDQTPLFASTAIFETRLSDLSQKSLFYFSVQSPAVTSFSNQLRSNWSGGLQFQFSVGAFLVVISHIFSMKLVCPACCFPTVFFAHRFLLESCDLRVCVELQYLFCHGFSRKRGSK